MDSKPCLSFPMSQSLANGEAPAHSWSKRIWRRLVGRRGKNPTPTPTISSKTEEAVTLADKIVVLGAGRDAIRRAIPVTLTRPRDRSCHEFGEARGELLREFHLNSN